MNHWPGASVLLLAGSVLLVTVFLPIYAYRTYSKSKSVKASFIYTIIALVYFIVFELLLAINFSHNILGEFVSIEKNETKTTLQLNTLNNKKYEILLNDTAYKNLDISKIKTETNGLYNYIEDIKIRLISKSEEVSINNAKHLAKNTHLLQNITDYKIPYFVMFGREKNGDAYTLKKKIETYRDQLINVVGNNSKEAKTIMSILSTTITSDLGIFPEWEDDKFRNIMFIGVIGVLSDIQLDIRIAESTILNHILSKK